MSEPLSKVLGFKNKKCDKYCYNDEHIKDCGCADYNKALFELDQLSPDVNALRHIIFCWNMNKEYDISEITELYRIGIFKGRDKDDLNELAQEIINKMNVWIIKKG